MPRQISCERRLINATPKIVRANPLSGLLFIRCCSGIFNAVSLLRFICSSYLFIRLELDDPCSREILSSLITFDHSLSLRQLPIGCIKIRYVFRSDDSLGKNSSTVVREDERRNVDRKTRNKAGCDVFGRSKCRTYRGTFRDRALSSCHAFLAAKHGQPLSAVRPLAKPPLPAAPVFRS